MKIRGDFVTNSSSANFILTAKEDVLDIKIQNYQRLDKPGAVDLVKFIKDKLLEQGSRVRIGEQDFLYLIKAFELGKRLELNDTVEAEKIPDTDFSEYSDEEMWNLINWIAVRGKSENLYGIGATQLTDLLNCTCGH